MWKGITIIYSIGVTKVPRMEHQCQLKEDPYQWIEKHGDKTKVYMFAPGSVWEEAKREISCDFNRDAKTVNVTLPKEGIKKTYRKRIEDYGLPT